MEVLDYGQHKAGFEKDMSARHPNSWVPMVGHYDSIRSLHALLSLFKTVA
jgi:hypothetical protein